MFAGKNPDGKVNENPEQRRELSQPADDTCFISPDYQAKAGNGSPNQGILISNARSIGLIPCPRSAQVQEPTEPSDPGKSTRASAMTIVEHSPAK